MIQIKSPHEIDLMRRAGKITAAARALAGEMVAPGVTTKEIDKAVRKFIEGQGAKPSFLGYAGYPGSACISVNDVVIHGIPDGRVIKDGDIVSVDVGAYIDGFHGDCAATFVAGNASEEAIKLIEATKQSFFEGLKFAKPGFRISDISRAIQTYAESFGYGIVRDYVGHGVGTNLHEDPEVPNYVAPRSLAAGRTNPRLVAGMTIAIEPMVNQGTYKVKVMPDGWTVKTLDGKLSAHYENTVLITNGEPEILTTVGEF
jgi:methionyl aminopeptidase